MDKVKKVTEGYMNGVLRVSEFRYQLLMCIDEMANEDVNALAVVLADAFEKEEG